MSNFVLVNDLVCFVLEVLVIVKIYYTEREREGEKERKCWKAGVLQTSRQGRREAELLICRILIWSMKSCNVFIRT